MKRLIRVLLCATMTQSLLATVTTLDERGKPIQEALDVPALRIAPKEVIKTLYGQRIIRLSAPERLQTRVIFSAEDGTTNTYNRLDGTIQELGKFLTQITLPKESNNVANKFALPVSCMPVPTARIFSLLST